MFDLQKAVTIVEKRLTEGDLYCERCDFDLNPESEMLNLIKNKLLCSCCATEISWQEERDFEENFYKQ